MSAYPVDQRFFCVHSRRLVNELVRLVVPVGVLRVTLASTDVLTRV
jgi:hypothetical protein